MKKRFIFIGILIILSLLMISFVIALDKFKSEDKINKKITIYDFSGKKFAEYKLLSNMCDLNFRFCNATIETNFFEEDKLFDSISFFQVIENKLFNGKVRNFKIYYYTLGEKIDVPDYSCFPQLINGTFQNSCILSGTHKENADEWTLYNGETFKKNEIKKWLIKAEKNPSSIIDWVINVFGGLSLREWSIWGNITQGNDSEVILNSPINNFIDIDNLNIIINCSSNVTNGAGVVNESLWGNFNGTWFLNETIINFDSIEQTSISNIDFNYDNFDDGSVNQTIWTNSSTSTTESGGEVVIFGEGKAGSGHPAFLTSTNLPALSTIENISFQTTQIWNDGSSNLIFGGKTYSFTQTGTANVSWILNKTGSSFSIWKNGVNQSVLTPSNNIINFTSLDGSGGGIQGQIRIAYFLYSNSINTAVTATFNKSISQDTLWTCSAGDTDGVIGFAQENRTILLNIAPNITINSPNIVETSTNITLNFTFTDDFPAMDYCFYNVTTSGLGVVVADNPINCSNAVEYQTISAGTGYILNVFGNDTMGNSNITSLIFDVTITTPSTGGGGGGGGGGASIIASITEPVQTSCSIYYPPVALSWAQFIKSTKTNGFNSETFSLLIQFWYRYWDYSTCQSSASLVPLNLNVEGKTPL